MNHIVIFCCIVIHPCITLASNGDRSKFYHICTEKCPAVCSQEGGGGLLWDCQDECRHTCMWRTVAVFTKHGLNVPQFYGKWPFTRWMGLQEPASAVFSLLNMISHLVMLSSFIRTVPSHAPLYRLWLGYGLVNVNGWLWSSVFHTRDTRLTELMDYVCAHSMVLFSLYAALSRCVLLGRGSVRTTATVGVMCVAGLLYHVHYLTTAVKLNYSYNMTVNIAAGGVGMCVWLWWCRMHRPVSRWRCEVCVISVCIGACLELADFAPLWWVLDAHALWHLVTAPLPLLWYRFLIEDTIWLMRSQRSSPDKLA